MGFSVMNGEFDPKTANSILIESQNDGYSNRRATKVMRDFNRDAVRPTFFVENIVSRNHGNKSIACDTGIMGRITGINRLHVTQLTPGTHVLLPRLAYCHHGIYIGGRFWSIYGCPTILYFEIQNRIEILHFKFYT